MRIRLAAVAAVASVSVLSGCGLLGGEDATGTAPPTGTGSTAPSALVVPQGSDPEAAGNANEELATEMVNVLYGLESAFTDSSDGFYPTARQLEDGYIDTTRVFDEGMLPVGTHVHVMYLTEDKQPTANVEDAPEYGYVLCGYRDGVSGSLLLGNISRDGDTWTVAPFDNCSGVLDPSDGSGLVWDSAFTTIAVSTDAIVNPLKPETDAPQPSVDDPEMSDAYINITSDMFRTADALAFWKDENGAYPDRAQFMKAAAAGAEDNEIAWSLRDFVPGNTVSVMYVNKKGAPVTESKKAAGYVFCAYTVESPGVSYLYSSADRINGPEEPFREVPINECSTRFESSGDAPSWNPDAVSITVTSDSVTD